MKDSSLSNSNKLNMVTSNVHNDEFEHEYINRQTDKYFHHNYSENTAQKGMNIVYNSDINNFIHDIVELKSSQEGISSLRTSLKSVNASSSNVKFGKLTLNRGPSKEKIEAKANFLSESESSGPYKKFMTPKIKNSSNSKKTYIMNYKHSDFDSTRSRQSKRESGFDSRVLSHSSRVLVSQPLFNHMKTRRESKFKSKSPIKGSTLKN